MPANTLIVRIGTDGHAGKRSWPFATGNTDVNSLRVCLSDSKFGEATSMRKITPHLWFDKEAKEAAELYTSQIPNSKIANVKTLHNTPSGDCDLVSFVVSGQAFMAISAVPLYKFNPSVSFHVKCKARDEVDSIFERLSNGGKVLMPLGSYPFSDRYGWLEDKYGLSWQVILAGEREMKQRISPVLMFVGKVCGKTEEAINYYAEVFKNSPAGATASTNVNILARYGTGEYIHVGDRKSTRLNSSHRCISYAVFCLKKKKKKYKKQITDVAIDDINKHRYIPQ